MSSVVGKQTVTESRATPLPRSLENTIVPGLQFRARVSGDIERLTAMQKRKTLLALAVKVLSNEGGAGRLELTKA